MDADTISRLKEIPIQEIVERLNIVVKRGKALCFSHDEKTPSLDINFNKNNFHCFGCGIKGDQIELVKAYRSVNFNDACEWLSREFLNVPINSFNNKRILKRSLAFVERSGKEIISELINGDKEIFKWIIDNSDLSSHSISYLTERGISPNLISKLNIRDILSPAVLLSQLIKYFDPKKLIRSGLVKEGGNSLSMIWRDPVILFPFYGLDLQICYLQARNIHPVKPKYINIPSLPLPIYNINVLSVMIPGDRLILCEGIIDTISVIDSGNYAVGFLGANSFKDEYVDLLKNYEIVVMPDADRGGESFTKSIKSAFRKIDKKVIVFKLKTGFNDFNEYYRKNNIL
jgi:DNA primase